MNKGGVVRKSALIAVVVISLIGAAIAAVSTSQYLRIQKEGLEQKSFCTVSDVFDCDITNASSYSTIAGVPAAWLGFCAYILIGGMAAYGAFSKRQRRATVAAAWFISLAVVLYSIRMAYVLAAVLGVFCIECISMYVVNILTAVLLRASLAIPFKETGKFLADYARAAFGKSSELGFAPKIVSHAAIAFMVFGLGWIAMSGKSSASADKVPLAEKIRAHYMQSLYAALPDPAWPFWGGGDGRVVLIEFSDFECPFCRMAAFNIRPYLQEFKKDVRYYFVNYPLDEACNPYLEQPMHKNACLAAYAAECASKFGDFWGFHDDLFRNSRNLNRENILKLVAARKWDEKDFESCMDSDETKKRVQSEIEAARKIHISGTPTIIVGGRRLKYWRDPKFLQAVVRTEVR